MQKTNTLLFLGASQQQIIQLYSINCWKAVASLWWCTTSSERHETQDYKKTKLLQWNKWRHKEMQKDYKDTGRDKRNNNTKRLKSDVKWPQRGTEQLHQHMMTTKMHQTAAVTQNYLKEKQMDHKDTKRCKTITYTQIDMRLEREGNNFKETDTKKNTEWLRRDHKEAQNDYTEV